MPDADVLRELARIANDTGPALAPSGHDELLRSIVSTARRLFSAAACSMALLDASEEHLVFHVADGAGAREVIGLRIPSTAGIAGFVVRSGQALVIEDVTRDPRFAASFADETGYRPTSIVAVPLETQRSVLGVLEILDPASIGLARTQEMEIVGLFADQAALAIENSRVFADLGRQLLLAASRAADGDVATALEAVATERRRRRSDLAEIAALFAELGELGDEERTAAARLLTGFLTYARTARRPR
jgi:GAF domain-containing protein